MERVTTTEGWVRGRVPMERVTTTTEGWVKGASTGGASNKNRGMGQGGSVQMERVTTTERGVTGAGGGQMAKNHQNKVGCAILNNF